LFALFIETTDSEEQSQNEIEESTETVASVPSVDVNDEIPDEFSDMRSDSEVDEELMHGMSHWDSSLVLPKFFG
jgi:hypothetical protein